MAKQTVITAAMGINSGRAPDGNGHAVRVDLFFDAQTPDIEISLTAVMMNGYFTNIQCLYIDNSLNPAPVILTFPGIQQRIVVNGFTQSLEPIYVNDTTCSGSISAHSLTVNKAGFPVSIWFSNVPQPYYQKDNLQNNVFSQYGLAKFGNNGGYAYSWSFDLSAVMVNYKVADWQTIYVDNSKGFQHINVYDGSLGTVIYIVNPYTISQFSTNNVGTTVYSFFAWDQILGGPQAAFAYGYDVGMLFKSMKQPSFSIDCSGNNGGMYSANFDQALLANVNYVLPINESRKRVGMQAPNPFYYNTSSGAASGDWKIATAIPAGLGVAYQGFIDAASYTTFQRGVNITNGAVAQTITIRDRF